MNKDDTEAVKARLEKGGIMVGSFRISRNYFSLSPGQVYVYDTDKAITHDKSGLPASHVAMMIGIGHRLTASNRFSRHMVM
jgi:senataxin